LDLLEHKMPMFEFMLRSIIARFDKNRAPGVSITDSPELARKLTPENQAQIVSVAAPILKGIQDIVMQSQYIKKLHTWTLVDESVIKDAVDKSQLSQINQSFNSQPNPAPYAPATVPATPAPILPDIEDDPDDDYLLDQEPPPDDDYFEPPSISAPTIAPSVPPANATELDLEINRLKNQLRSLNLNSTAAQQLNAKINLLRGKRKKIAVSNQ
jgi:DNA primase